MPTISVCVGTHERARLLADRALAGLLAQVRPPDEVVVADSSAGDEARHVVQGLRAPFPVRWVRSERRALPWNRWLGFRHSGGDIVLFLDDDVRLDPRALLVLEAEYARLAAARGDAPAGVGFIITDDGMAGQTRRAAGSLRERWLGTAHERPGTLTPGGLPVTTDGLRGGGTAEVHHLSGGAMSYRRDVLAAVGPLDALVALYDAGLGRGEDVVLSHSARRHGALFLITEPLAWHPREKSTTLAPYAIAGWRWGLAATWGRAHTLGWLATSRRAHLAALGRVASLELARAAGTVARRPWRGAAWAQLAGTCAGIARIVAQGRRIPPAPRAAASPAAAVATPSVEAPFVPVRAPTSGALRPPR